MDLTKHAHACVTVTKDDRHLLIDPGAFTPDAADLISGAKTIFITHEHVDHFDEELIAGALAERPELRVYGPAAVVSRWEAYEDQVVPVSAGDAFTAEGFEVAVFGGLHAPLHADIPRCANVGFLIDETLYHPGDSYDVPPSTVTTLLLPTSGPWTKMGEGVDFVRAVKPEQVVQIHEVMLSETGQQAMARFISPAMLSSVALQIVPIGDTIAV